MGQGVACCVGACVSIPQWGCYSPEKPMMALWVGSHGSGEGADQQMASGWSKCTQQSSTCDSNSNALNVWASSIVRQ